MNTELFKDVLGFIAMTAFALKWSFDWKTDGFVGHTFTVTSAIFASIYLAIIMVEIART